MQTDVKKHITVVAAIHIAFGVLGLVLGALVFLVVVGVGLLSGDQDAFAITSVVGTAIGAFMGVLSLPSVLAGAGLLRFKPWARLLTLILAALNLVNIPIGTLIGIYTVWVLLQDETEALFAE